MSSVLMPTYGSPISEISERNSGLKAGHPRYAELWLRLGVAFAQRV